MLERLLDDDHVWHRWDGDVAELLKTIQAALEREFSSPNLPGPSWDSKLRRERLLWLFDRLAPVTDFEAFEPFRRNSLGLYAWGRRLPPGRRDGLLHINSPESQTKFINTVPIQAQIYAWCDSCPDDQLETLLAWPEQWATVLRSHDICGMPSPEREFSRRCKDRALRRSALLESLNLGVSLSREAGVRGELGKRVAWTAFPLLLQDAAADTPGIEQPCPSEDEWINWFKNVLTQPAFAHLAEFGRAVLARSASLAEALWIWHHGPNEWRQLYEYACGCNPDRRVFTQLSLIVPKDELDSWDHFVLDQPQDRGEMRAYCRWIDAEYVEVLRTHFDHPYSDWRACAYQNYLAKAREPILNHHWGRSERLERWQFELLDRRLFAPAPLRPAAIVEDVQQVEADLRLRDPFNHRAF